MFYNDPIDITAEVWVEILTDNEVTRVSDINILRMIFESQNHELRASEIAVKLNLSHHGPVNLQVGRYSKRIVEKAGIQPPLRSNGKPRWWHVPFLGYERGGKFPWIMRPELAMAFEKVFSTNSANFNWSGEITLEDAPNLSEGALTQILVNRYERNRQARSICIDNHGCECVVCGFNFEELYGPIGKNKIHVHHLRPLSELQQEYEVDPIRDLAPVCPNCHLIIHSKREPFTIGEVINIINRC